MRSVLLASLRTHTRRYVAAAVAVVIGVAFVVVTDGLASATRAGVVAGVELPYRNADVVISELDGATAAALVDHARATGDAVAVLGWSMQPVTGSGRLVADRADVGVVADDESLRWQVLEDGRFPDRRGEAVADANAAKSSGVRIGDVLRVGSGSRAVDTTVVGLVDSPSASVGASIYLPWDDVAGWAATFYVDSVAYGGWDDTADRVALAAAPGAAVRSADAFVADRSAELSRGVDVIALVLLLFASIALFVAVLVIANTFSILFAQRRRDFALLRCVGATRRQVLRSVRVEAAVLGVVGSTAGVLVGLATGWGLVTLIRSLSPGAPLGAVDFSLRWLGVAFAVGVVATLVASWLPTRRGVSVGPLAALRPADAVTLRTSAGKARIGLGGVLTLGGAGLLALAVDATSPPVMIVGGAAAFTGILLLGPVLVPALIRVAGSATGRLLGPAGRLATGNAVRNPRRTAATTASLLIGVTLTTAVLTGLASSRGAVDDEMAAQNPIDLTLTATGSGLPRTLVDDVRAIDAIGAVVAVPGTAATVSDGVGELQVLGVPDDADAVTRAAVLAPQPGEILLPHDFAPDAPTVRVTVGDQTVELRVRTGEGWGPAALVARPTLALLTATPTTGALWARAADGADPQDVAGDLAALGTPVGADLGNGLATRGYVDLQLDVLTASVVGLLGIAVLIALVGIGNTLGLSVLERGRENALLRALGLTRRQLRLTLAVEALLLSLVATVLGTAIGVVFAWVGVQAMVRPVVETAPVVLPLGQLATVVVVAGLAGLVACLLPARRATRVAPAAGLALD